MGDDRTSSGTGRRHLTRPGWLAPVFLAALIMGSVAMAADSVPASDNDLGLQSYDIHEFDGGEVHVNLVGASYGTGTRRAAERVLSELT